jgi:deoxycytidylate deaminase
MRGPCAKRRVTCLIVNHHEEHAFGENDCANPQKKCPRKPGEDYTKCKTICQQSGHAEIQALAAAKEAGMSVKDATAHIDGHYWICEPCGKALREAGVRAVHMDLAA